MIFIRSISVVSLLLLVMLNLKGQDVRKQLGKEIDKIIRYEDDVFVRTHSGFVLSVNTGDSIYRYAYGKVDYNDGPAVNDSVSFPLGGISHALVAMTADALQQRRPGILDKQLSALNLPPEFAAFGTISLSKLLSHTSGIPKILPGMSHLRQNQLQPYAKMERDTLMQYLAAWCKLHPAGNSPYQHSQYNYFLAYEVLMAYQPDLTGSVYAESGFSFNRITLPENRLVKLYSNEKTPLPYFNYAGLTPILGGNADLQNAEKMATRMLNGYRQQQRMIFNFEIAETGDEKYVSSSSFRITKAGRSGYVYMLTGNSDRSSAIMVLCPGTGTAVVALGNSGYSLHILAMNIMRMVNHNWKLRKFL